ncbi:MAG: DUF4446 family protein [Eubacteriales bacterium]|nr:DUF4446 family protein [Eubacteriales bacterium]
MDDSNIIIYIYILAGVCLALIMGLLLTAIVMGKKISKLNARYKRFMGALGDKNIEEMLETCMVKMQGNEQNIEINRKDIEALNKITMRCVQKVGTVRYNAFENVGSNLCYSIALLDMNNNGVVFTGLYSRDSSSTFAKPIEGGKSKFTLSEEEIEAVKKAMYNMNG